MDILTENILESIRSLVISDPDDTNFDNDILAHIQSTMLPFIRIGAFDISKNITTDTSWGDLTKDTNILYSIKNYIYLKVKLIFDPPSSSSVLNWYTTEINRLEFDINFYVENEEVTNE